MYDEENQLDQNEFDAVINTLGEKGQGTPPPEEPELPEKLRGKSIQEIAKMYQEAEKLIGRQAQEVGEVRRLADELIRSKMQPVQPAQQAAESEDIDEVDFFADPKTAVKKMVENHPVVKQAYAATQQLSQMERKRMFLERHPDAQDIVTSPEFQSFVSATPVRQQLYRAADQQYNIEAADELLTTFKELTGVQRKQQTTALTEQFNEQRNTALKAAAVSVGGAGSVNKPPLRRADLIRLQIQDPDRYEALQPEIMQAYAEGRVK